MDYKEDSNRIYALDDQDNIIAEITFPDVGNDVVCIDHTFVDTSLRGMGIAAQLCDLAYDAIKAKDKKCVLQCPYAVKWFHEHPEKLDIAVE